VPTAVINQADCRIRLNSEHLEVFGHNEQTKRDEVLREIPIDPIFALQMAGRIITAKLYNQRRVLQRLGATRQEKADPTAAAATRGNSNDSFSHSQNPESGVSATLAWLDNLGRPLVLGSGSDGALPAYSGRGPGIRSVQPSDS
jgi:hypothetical protein